MIQTDNSDAPTPVSEADCQRFLAALTQMVPSINDTLNAIIAKKAAFDAISGAATFLAQDLQSVDTSTKALGVVLMSKSPVRDLSDTDQEFGLNLG